MDDDWEGHPLRKDYPIGGEPVRFSGAVMATVARTRLAARIDPSVLRGEHPLYEPSRIPHPIPTVLEVPAELRESEDILQVNFGPNHPSTHGVLRLVVDLNGERSSACAR